MNKTVAIMIAAFVFTGCDGTRMSKDRAPDQASTVKTHAQDSDLWLISWSEWPQPKTRFSQPAIAEHYAKGRPKVEGDTVWFVDAQTGTEKAFTGKAFTIQKIVPQASAPSESKIANDRLQEAKNAKSKEERQNLLNLIINSYPDTPAGKEAKRLLDQR